LLVLQRSATSPVISLTAHTLKSFTAPSALLTKFHKKFHTKCLETALIFRKLFTKTLCFDDAMFHLTMNRYRETRTHRPYCFLSMFKLHCKRHYRNLEQHIAGVQHDVNTSRKWRRRDADTRSAAVAAARRLVTIAGGGVSKMAAAAAHSSTPRI